MESEYILQRNHRNVFADFVVGQLENWNLIYVIQQENQLFECLDPLNVLEYAVAFVILIVLKSLLCLLTANLLVSRAI